MSITTDREIEIFESVHRDYTVKIGVSKPISDLNLTYQDIESNAYCGSVWLEFQNFRTSENDVTGVSTFLTDRIGEEIDYVPFKMISYGTSGNGYPTYYPNPNTPYTGDGINAKIIYVYSTQTHVNCKLSDFDGLIITQMDISKFRLTNSNEFGSGYEYTNGKSPCRKLSVEYKAQTSETNISWTTVSNIHPCMIFEYNGHAYITSYIPDNNDGDTVSCLYGTTGYCKIPTNCITDINGENGITPYFNITDATYSNTQPQYFNGDTNGSYGGSGYYEFNSYLTDIDGIGCFLTFRLNRYNNTSKFVYGWNGDNALDYMSRFGLYFYDIKTQTTYKPIINGGWVTGYSNDLNAESEIDTYDYNSGTSHTISKDPPKELLKDRLDNIGLTLNAEGGSFIRWYAVTASQMTSLLSWLNTPNPIQGQEIPAGFNAMSHIVGCHQAPFSISSKCNTSSTTIMVGGLQTEISGNLLGNQGSYSTIDLGTVSIPQKHHNFLDYEPYTKIDLYIPFCGVVSLPPSVFVGKSLTVTLLFDIFSGECHGCVFVNNTFYTSISGNITSMLAVSSENVGAIKQAMVNGIMSIAGGGVATVAGVATGNIPAVVGGAVTMLGGTAKSLMDINGIAPEMRGSSGGRASFYKPHKCILYMTYPENTIDDTYIAQCGLGVNKSVSLSSGAGYTVVPNPVINVNATATEKTMIENAFKTGVIL